MGNAVPCTAVRFFAHGCSPCRAVGPLRTPAASSNLSTATLNPKPPNYCKPYSKSWPDLEVRIYLNPPSGVDNHDFPPHDLKRVGLGGIRSGLGTEVSGCRSKQLRTRAVASQVSGRNPLSKAPRPPSRPVLYAANPSKQASSILKEKFTRDHWDTGEPDSDDSSR